MKSFNQLEANAKMENGVGFGPVVPVVPIVPRLMRAVPSNIARVIGDFDSVEGSEAEC